VRALERESSQNMAAQQTEEAVAYVGHGGMDDDVTGSTTETDGDFVPEGQSSDGDVSFSVTNTSSSQRGGSAQPLLEIELGEGGTRPEAAMHNTLDTEVSEPDLDLWTHNGVTYLVDRNSLKIYDQETGEANGQWGEPGSATEGAPIPEEDDGGDDDDDDDDDDDRHEGASKSATGTFLDSTTSGGGSDSGTDDEESEQIELEVWVGPDGKEYHVDRETHVIYDGNGEEAGKWNPDWPIPEPEPGTFELGTGAQWDNALEDTESSSSGSNF
jgi:hypothetical protein